MAGDVYAYCIMKKISQAFWQSLDSGLIILSEDWSMKRGQPPLLLGPDSLKFDRLTRLGTEECGRYYRYFRRKSVWVFRVLASRYPQLKAGAVRLYLGGDFNGWGDAQGQRAWELKPKEVDGELVYELRVSLKALPSEGISLFKFVTEHGDWLNVPDSAPNLSTASDGVTNFMFNPKQSGRHMFHFEMHTGFEAVGGETVVWKEANYEEARSLPHTQLLTTLGTTLELGANVYGDTTVFRLFAPRAQRVTLHYSQQLDTADEESVVLKRVNSTTWEARIAENLSGAYYMYSVEGQQMDGTSHFDGSFRILDPYAKACLGHRGPGIVVDPQRLHPVREAFTPPDWHDLVILEAHVRDLAAHAPIELSEDERRGYSGLRKWLKAEGSYLKELGVNAVELQPIQEFDNRTAEEYHWGYMTVNYFSPESSYALDAAQASQVEEFKGLVQDFHDEGLAVIIDVVYNHVGEPNHLLFIDKHYYFHLDDAQDLMNWSGCGNDLRCDTPMGRHLIIESLKHMIRVYDVDGFRFDLAELIGIEVLREIEFELKAIKPSLILIAEPWSFRGHIQNELRETGFASWNDGFRESIAKYVKGRGNQELIRYFLAGSPGTSRFAAQTINYTESHDDHCWLDRITERKGHNGSDPTLLDRRRTHLMASILFASLGVPMLSAGQDFLRSKRGVSNTYQRGDLNALDYNKRFVYSGTHTYFRDWIHFRRSELGKALRYDGGLADGYLEYYYTDGSSATVSIINADASVDASTLVYAVNPHMEYANIEVEGLETASILQIADQERFDLEGIQNAKIPVSGTRFSLPPLTCGLWIVSA